MHIIQKYVRGKRHTKQKWKYIRRNINDYLICKPYTLLTKIQPLILTCLGSLKHYIE